MANVSRVTAIWSGFQGAPGYSKFSFTELVGETALNAAGAAVRALFADCSAFLPNGSSVTVQTTVQHFDIFTGTLVGESTMGTTPATVAGAAAVAPYAGGSGVVITWITGAIINGRSLKGRTFMVPFVACFESDGTVSSTARTTITNAARGLALAANCDLAVWKRVYNTADPPQQISGFLSSTTDATVKDMASQLRTRRL